MIWAVLIGNTRVVSALMDRNKAVRKLSTATETLRTTRNTRRWAESLRKTSDAEGVIVASVVPPVDAGVRESIRGAFGKGPEFLDSGRKWGIKIRLKKPSQVGADRLANGVAAKELYGTPVIVVDFGTGTTFDVVDRQGAYCGGAILPGLGISLKALHEFTAKIPLIGFKKARKAVGRTTEEAVRSGVYHGAIGATRELLLRIRKEMGTVAPAVATGGWCGVFQDTHIFHQIEPDLSLIGLSLIWRNRREGTKKRGRVNHA